MSAHRSPHIILIITDQQRYDTIGALGYEYAVTPNLDKLAGSGTVFSHCYCAGASCVPARGSLFTGYYPHTTGILTNRSDWSRTWLSDFQAQGYYTVNIGKMHTQPMDVAAGFDQRLVVENKDRSEAKKGRDFIDEWDKLFLHEGIDKPCKASYKEHADYYQRLGAFDWPLDEQLHSDVFTGELASAWIKSYGSAMAGEQPLFIQIGFPGPHPPYDPVARTAQEYLAKDLPIAAVTEPDLDSQPPPLKALRDFFSENHFDGVAHIVQPLAELRKRQRAYYMANVTMIDEQVGKILNALKEADILDNSVVVFTSDHGDCLGDHGHAQKWTMYEQVTRVPLIVWQSARSGEAAVFDGLVQQMDVAPTLFELAGVPPPVGLEAQSFGAALEGGTPDLREYVFCEQSRDMALQTTRFMTMIRSRDWKLVHFMGEEFGQLFDLRSDPSENDNLWGREEHVGIQREMSDAFYQWRIESQYITRDWPEKWR